MSTQESRISGHYGHGSVMQRVLAGLKQAGKDLNALTVDDLAPVDEFHSRGRISTDELVALSIPSQSDEVLDVGCGLGGSVRHLASTYGCRVTGVDLTGEYIEAARQLTRLTDLESLTRFVQGSALDLPFEDASFDLVWTEHAQMNIQNKSGFYEEIHRVLKPGGQLLFHDIFAGTDGEPDFPVPWAEHSALSFLVKESRARELMSCAGLLCAHWINKVEESLTAFQAAMKKIQSTGLPPVGIHLLMGDNAQEKIANYVSSMQRGAITVAMGVAEKPKTR